MIGEESLVKYEVYVDQIKDISPDTYNLVEVLLYWQVIKTS